MPTHELAWLRPQGHATSLIASDTGATGNHTHSDCLANAQGDSDVHIPPAAAISPSVHTIYSRALVVAGTRTVLA